MDLVVDHPFLVHKGGVEKVVLEIAKAFNPIIYCVRYSPERTFPELKEFDIRILRPHLLEGPFFWLKKDERRYWAATAGLRFYFTKIKEDYDVINAHGSPSEWIRNRNERVVFYCNSPNRAAFDLYEWRVRRLPLWRRPIDMMLVNIFKRVEHPIVEKIEVICTNSEVTNQRIKKYLHRNDAKIIHPGVDPKEYQCKSYNKFFLYPSRIVLEKRFEMAIEAFKMFYKKHKGWKLILAGGTDKEDYLSMLKKKAEGYPIEIITNPIEKDLRELYATCYATLFCAIDEDWGLTPLEAMASCKPCISVNEGGPRYSIKDGETGFLVNNVEEMTKRMIELAEDRDKTEMMGKKASEHVKKNYTWKMFINKMRNVFKEFSSASP